MDENRPPLTENDRRSLLEAILNDDYDTIRRLMGKCPPSSVIWLDSQKNTPLHYAVATRKSSIIELFIEEFNSDPTTKNLRGESAIDWWQKIFLSTIEISSATALERVVPAIVNGNCPTIKEFLLFGLLPDIPCVHEGIPQRLVHVAIRNKRWPIIAILFDDPRTANTLNIPDGSGQTPLSLLRQQQQDDTNAKALLTRALAILREAELTVSLPPPCPDVPINPWLPEDHQQHILTLREYFFRRTQKQDFTELQATLPTLCGLAYFACWEALRDPQESEKCLERQVLLQKLSGGAGSQLLLQVQGMLGYLQKIISQNLIHQLIKVSDRFKKPGMSKPNLALAAKGEIYINPALAKNTGELWFTLLHELTHVAVLSEDYADTHQTIPNKWDLNQLLHLAKDAKPAKLDPKVIWVSKIQWLLEHKGAISLAQFYATQNAETIAAFIVGAFFIKKDFGHVDQERNMLCPNYAFYDFYGLEKIQQQYETELKATPTTESSQIAVSVGEMLFSSHPASKYPKAGKSFTSLRVEAGNDSGSPGGSSVNTASSSPSLPQRTLLPQQMAALPDMGEARTGILLSETQSTISPERNPTIVGLPNRNQRAKSVT